MAINENKKYMNIGKWTCSPRQIERIIIRNYKNNELVSEIEFRYFNSENNKYISLFKDLLLGSKEKAYRYSEKEKYICKLIESNDNLIAIIVRLK